MHQSIPSANIPATPGVLHLLSAQVPGFVPSELPGGGGGVYPRVGSIIYYQSTMLSVNAAWRHIPASDVPSIAALLLQNLFQSLGKTLKLLSMVLKLELKGMTKE